MQSFIVLASLVSELAEGAGGGGGGGRQNISSFLRSEVL